jgi:hypothetical protein
MFEQYVVAVYAFDPDGDSPGVCVCVCVLSAVLNLLRKFSLAVFEPTLVHTHPLACVSSQWLTPPTPLPHLPRR